MGISQDNKTLYLFFCDEMLFEQALDVRRAVLKNLFDFGELRDAMLDEPPMDFITFERSFAQGQGGDGAITQSGFGLDFGFGDVTAFEPAALDGVGYLFGVRLQRCQSDGCAFFGPGFEPFGRGGSESLGGAPYRWDNSPLTRGKN